MKEENFKFDVCGTDTYTTALVDGSYQNGKLSITTSFFPEGYVEDFECPECGELIVSLDKYNPNKTYFCPECGGEIDFSDIAPVIEKETITIR